MDGFVTDHRRSVVYLDHLQSQERELSYFYPRLSLLVFAERRRRRQHSSRRRKKNSELAASCFFPLLCTCHAGFQEQASLCFLLLCPFLTLFTSPKRTDIRAYTMTYFCSLTHRRSKRKRRGTSHFIDRSRCCHREDSIDNRWAMNATEYQWIIAMRSETTKMKFDREINGKWMPPIENNEYWRSLRVCLDYEE